jgi:hypothetical protein
MAAQETEVVPNATTPEEFPPIVADPHEKIAELAYQLWLERGCPIGSDQADWFRAELMLKSQSEDAAEKSAAST